MTPSPPPTPPWLPSHDSAFTSKALYFASGLAAVLMLYSLYSHLETFNELSNQQLDRKKRDVIRQEANQRVEDSIPLKSLAYLTQSTNVNVQSSAVKIVLDRAMSAQCLSAIIDACKNDKPMESRIKGISTLQMLTRRENNRAALLAAGALQVLVDTLKCTDNAMPETTQRYAAVAICDLIQGSDMGKHHVIGLGILDAIKRILTSDQVRNNELKYWTLMVLYQISRCDPFPRVLIEEGFVRILAVMARMTYGNTNMPKFCIQSLVRIVSNVDPMEAKAILSELLSYNVIELISICLRGEDLELVYWAAGLMHEFVMKDVATSQFREIKSIHTILSGLLSTEEVYISRVVLRTVKFLAYADGKFRKEMTQSGMVKKIMKCLTLDDDDVRYWSILCIHAVAGHVESHPDIITSNEFNVLLDITESRRVHVALYISDMLSLFCCLSVNHELLAAHRDQLISTLNELMDCDEIDVQYNAVGAVFNLMAMRDDFAEKVRDQCLDTLVSMCVSSTHERLQLSSSKSLLTMAIRYRIIITRVTLQVIEPLINICVGISHHIIPVIMMQSLLFAIRHQGDEHELAQQQQQHPKSYRHRRRFGIANSLKMSSLSSEDTDSDESDSQKRNHHFLKFELPLRSRLQFVGALSALRILLENEELFGDVIAGNVIGHLLADVERMKRELDEQEEAVTTTTGMKKRTSKLRDMDESKPSSTNMEELPGIVCRFAETLFMLSLYPVLDRWAARKVESINLDELDEQAAAETYREFVTWLRTATRIITAGENGRENNELSQRQQQQQWQRRHQRPEAEGGEYVPWEVGVEDDEDSEFGIENRMCDDEDDEEIEEAFVSTRNVESAAERMGETRRRGEEHDSATVEESITVGRCAHQAKLYSGLASRSLLVLRSLVRHASIRRYLMTELHFVESIFYLYQHYRPLAEHVLTCIGTMICAESSFRMPDGPLQLMSVCIWKSAQLPMLQKRSFHFYSRLILNYVSRCISNSLETSNDPHFVEIDVRRRTKYSLLNHETRLEARNDSWTFESVRATHSTPTVGSTFWNRHKNHKYAYEVVLVTDGLMQIGWATDELYVDAEAGRGVGDDEHSYGYDGHRVKKWHGRNDNRRQTYGSCWAVGDTLTCAIDLDKQQIRYYQNGQDLGVAFEDVATDKAWYPTVSLSTGQECKFRFGGPLDRLKYLPEGYRPMSCLVVDASNQADNTATTSPLSPSEISSTNSNDDLGSLTDAMERMRVTSPDYDQQQQQSSFFASSPLALLPSRPAQAEDYSILPSLYFEAVLAFHDKQDRDVILGLQSIGDGYPVRLEYKHTIRKAFIVYGELARTDMFPLSLTDGDILGITFVKENNTVAITTNGTMLVVAYLTDDAFRPYSPFRSGNFKTIINYGSELFRWQRANSMPSKEKMTAYLHHLIQEDYSG